MAHCDRRLLIAVFLLSLVVLGAGSGVFPAALLAQVGPAPPARPSYKVGVGDVIALDVWKNPELGGEFTVLPDGSISVPLIGQVMAEGRSPREIQSDVAVLFEEFITAPAVSVAVAEIHSRKVYVLGQVNEPGAYDLLGDLRLLQALAAAGGLTDFAKKDEIILIRDEAGVDRKYQVSLKEITSGRRLADNFPLVPGDTIVVP